MRAALPGGRAERCLGKPVYVATVGSGECWVVQTGVGLKKAGASARALFQKQTFALSLSAGFAGALAAAEIGDVRTGTEVTVVDAGSHGPLEYCDVAGPSRDRFYAVLGGSRPGFRCITGRFVSIDRHCGEGFRQGGAGSTHGAIGLDMESAALARESAAVQIPFVIVRTVSDLLEEDLPLDFNLFLRPTGWLKGVAAVLANPMSLMGLASLGRQSTVAAQSLTRALGTSIEAFCSERPDLDRQTM